MIGKYWVVTFGERNSWSNLAGLPGVSLNMLMSAHRSGAVLPLLNHSRPCRVLGSEQVTQMKVWKVKLLLFPAACYHSWSELMNAFPCFLFSCSLMWILAYFISLCSLSFPGMNTNAEECHHYYLLILLCGRLWPLICTSLPDPSLCGRGLAVEPRLPWSFNLLSSSKTMDTRYCSSRTLFCNSLHAMY